MALLLAKFYKRPFTMDEMTDISNKFKDRKATSRSLNQLKKRGYLTKEGEYWCITREGIEYLYKNAKVYQGNDNV